MLRFLVLWGWSFDARRVGRVSRGRRAIVAVLRHAWNAERFSARQEESFVDHHPIKRRESVQASGEPALPQKLRLLPDMDILSVPNADFAILLPRTVRNIHHNTGGAQVGLSRIDLSMIRLCRQLEVFCGERCGPRRFFR